MQPKLLNFLLNVSSANSLMRGDLTSAHVKPVRFLQVEPVSAVGKRVGP
jgi:hypothetical protein